MSVQIQGLDKLYKVLGNAAANKTLVRPMHEAMEHMKAPLVHYPPQSGNKKVPFVSDKQRRYVFWAMGKGIIDVPYQRGRTLGNSWKTAVTKIRMSSRGIAGRMGTNIPYAQLVQWRKTQSRRFRGNWTTTDDVVEGNFVRRNVDRVFQRAIDKALGGK